MEIDSLGYLCPPRGQPQSDADKLQRLLYDIGRHHGKFRWSKESQGVTWLKDMLWRLETIGGYIPRPFELKKGVGEIFGKEDNREK